MSIRDMESDQNLQQHNGAAQGLTQNIWSVFEAVWSFCQDADQDQNSLRDYIISGALDAWKEQSDFENEWKRYNNKGSEQSTSFHSEDTDQVVWNNINASNHNHLKISDRVESRNQKMAKQFRGEEECIDDDVGGSDVVLNYKLDPLVEAHKKYMIEFYKEYPQLKLERVTEQEIRQSLASPFVLPERLQENFGLVQILIDDVRGSQCSDGSGLHQLSVVIHKDNRKLTSNWAVASPLDLAERALYRSNQRRIEQKLLPDRIKRFQSSQWIVHRNDPSIMSSYKFQLSDEEMVQSQYYGDSYGSEEAEDLQQSQLVSPEPQQPQFELINTDQSNIEFQPQNDDGITDSFESFTNQQDPDQQSLIRPMKLRRSNSQIQIQQGSYTSSEDSMYRSNQKLQKQDAKEDQKLSSVNNDQKREQYGQISKKNFSKYFMSSSEDSEC